MLKKLLISYFCLFKALFLVRSLGSEVHLNWYIAVFYHRDFLTFCILLKKLMKHNWKKFLIITLSLHTFVKSPDTVYRDKKTWGLNKLFEASRSTQTEFKEQLAPCIPPSLGSLPTTLPRIPANNLKKRNQWRGSYTLF